MRIFYTKKNIVTAEYDDGNNIIIVTWKNLFDGEIVLECGLALLSKIKKNTIIIMNIQHAMGFPPDFINAWLEEVFLLRINQIKIKSIIIIKPLGKITKRSYSIWFEIGRNFDGALLEVSDMSDAFQLIEILSSHR